LRKGLTFSNGQHVDLDHQGSLNMRRPIPSFVALVQETVRVDSEYYWSNTRERKGGTWLHFGIASAQTNEGIAFIYTGAPVQPATGQTYGSYALAQVIESWRQQYNLVDGTNCTGFQAQGGGGLDGGYPSLGNASNADHSPTNSWADSPGAFLSIARWLT